MKDQFCVAERNAVTVLERGAGDRPPVDERLIARARCQVQEHELLVGCPLNECVVAMDGLVDECDIVVAVPPDPQDLARERHGHSPRALADIDPGLVAGARYLEPRCALLSPRGSAPQRPTDRKQPGGNRQGTGETEPHHHDRRSPISFGHLYTRALRRLREALVQRFHASLQDPARHRGLR
jgi:hypothetical protein